MLAKFISSYESIPQIVLKVIKLPVACWNLLGNHESFSSLQAFQGVTALGTQHMRHVKGTVAQAVAGYNSWEIWSSQQGVTCSGAVQLSSF